VNRLAFQFQEASFCAMIAYKSRRLSLTMSRSVHTVEFLRELGRFKVSPFEYEVGELEEEVKLLERRGH
jgi:hypothetical protein